MAESNRNLAYALSVRNAEIIALLCLFGFLICILGFYPGWMSNDSAAQYGEAINNRYGDWHPPLMAYWWHFLIKLHEGPALMLLQNLAFYWLGFYLIAKAMYRFFGSAAFLIPLIGLWPGVLFPLGQIWKDVACASSLLLSWSIIINVYSQGRGFLHIEKAIIFVLCIYAIGVKPNAAVVLPFIFYNLIASNEPKVRFTKILVSAILTVSVFYLSSSIVPKERVQSTYPFQYTQIYDLLALSIKTEDNKFPSYINEKMGDESKNLEKYFWLGSNNALYYNAPFRVGTTDKEKIEELNQKWKEAVIAHPTDYLYHRFKHFLSLLRWGESTPAAVANPMIVPNQFGLTYESNNVSNLLITSLDRAPSVYFPWIYVASMICVIFIYKIIPLPSIFYSITLSNIFFVAPHFLIAPASDYRYLYYAILMICVCLVIYFFSIVKQIFGSLINWRSKIHE